MASPFEVHAGRFQQRIPTPFSAESGFAYEFGHAEHLDVYLSSGDRHELSQTFTVSAGSTLIRARVRIEAAPVPASWEFRALLNGVVHYRRKIADRTVTLSDVVIRLSVADLDPATNVITYQLRLM
jgi:hypothetical protein